MAQSQLPSDQRLRTLRILWGAFFAAILVYGIVLTVVLQRPGPVAPVDIGSIRAAVSVLAVVQAALSIWWRRRASGETDFGPSLGTPGEDPVGALQRNCIIVWAASEGIAIYGLVLGFLARDLGVFQPFAIAGLALLFVHRPAAWRQWPST